MNTLHPMARLKQKAQARQQEFVAKEMKKGLPKILLFGVLAPFSGIILGIATFAEHPLISLLCGVSSLWLAWGGITTQEKTKQKATTAFAEKYPDIAKLLK